jgi:hypothetical protein
MTTIEIEEDKRFQVTMDLSKEIPLTTKSI